MDEDILANPPLQITYLVTVNCNLPWHNPLNDWLEWSLRSSQGGPIVMRITDDGSVACDWIWRLCGGLFLGIAKECVQIDI